MSAKIFVVNSHQDSNEDFSNADIVLITDIKSLNVASSAKSSGILTVGIYSDTPDTKDVQKFLDVSDAVIKSSEPQNVIKEISELLNKSGFVTLDIDYIKSVLKDTGTAFAGIGYG